MERHLRRRAEQLAQPRRVLKPGKLHEEAVGTGALDRRLGHADLIDALAHDLEALLEGVVDPVAEAGFAERQSDQPVAGRHLDIGHRHSEPALRDGNRQRAQRFQRPAACGLVSDRDDDRLAGEANRLRLDAGGAQGAARIVEKRSEAISLQLGGVHFEHEVGASLKVEPERDLPLGQPVRHGGEPALREEVGKRGEDAGEDDEGIGYQNPA